VARADQGAALGHPRERGRGDAGGARILLGHVALLLGSDVHSRPESFTPVLDSITVGELIDTDGGTWRRRLPFFDAIVDESMCEIQRRQKTERKSLGVFRPVEVTDLKVTAAETGFADSQRALLNQASLFGDRAGDDTRAALEPLPVKARFAYRCSDPACPGHNQSLIDCELGALHRSLAQAPRLVPHSRPRAPEAHGSPAGGVAFLMPNRVPIMAPKLFTVGYQGRSLDEMIGDLVDAGVERLVDVRELPLSRRRGFSKTALGDALRHAGIEYVHVRALGNPKPNRERYWAGDVAGGAAVYRKHLSNGPRSALVELADSLGDEPACLLCFERNHAECHRDVIVEALRELRPGLAVDHL